MQNLMNGVIKVFGQQIGRQRVRGILSLSELKGRYHRVHIFSAKASTNHRQPDFVLSNVRLATRKEILLTDRSLRMARRQ